MPKVIRNVSVWTAGIFTALLTTALAITAQEKPKEVDKSVDYEAILNDRLGKGVTPEKNVVALLWQALGPTPSVSSRMPADYFKRLGIDEPPANGRYYVSISEYVRNYTNLDADDRERVIDQGRYARQRPWDEHDYPHLAAWLNANEKPLDLIGEACQRSDYYNPVVTHRVKGRPGLLIGALMPSVSQCRDAAEALTARAMRTTFARKYDASWRDLLACHRLGRQVARGGTVLEAVVGYAIENIAIQAELTFLEASAMPKGKLQDRLKQLQSLPPVANMADKMDVGERSVYLQSLQSVTEDAGLSLQATNGGNRPLPEKVDELPEDLRKTLARIDWEPAFADANRWFDRTVTAIRIEDRAARNREYDALDKDFAAAFEEALKLGTILEILREKERPKTVGISINMIVLKLLRLPHRTLSNARDRVSQNWRNLEVAFALAAYYRDQGRYPAKLADLVPKYVAAVPSDIFSGKDLIYTPSPTGYHFHSVGVNGVDEGGRGPDDSPPGDDLGMTMPLPPLKKPPMTGNPG